MRECFFQLKPGLILRLTRTLKHQHSCGDGHAHLLWFMCAFRTIALFTRLLQLFSFFFVLEPPLVQHPSLINPEVLISQAMIWSAGITTLGRKVLI